MNKNGRAHVLRCLSPPLSIGLLWITSDNGDLGLPCVTYTTCMGLLAHCVYGVALTATEVSLLHSGVRKKKTNENLYSGTRTASQVIANSRNVLDRTGNAIN